MSTFDQQTREMRRLYLREKLTLREIAKRFSLSFQAVHLRLVKAGVEMRPRIIPRSRRFPKDLLERMYISEGLTIRCIAENLGSCYETVKKELERHEIPRRKWRIPDRNKHPYLDSLKIGDSTRIPRPPGPRKPHLNIYTASAYRRIRVSVISVDAKTLEVTRTA